jgi:hypothetical protein
MAKAKQDGEKPKQQPAVAAVKHVADRTAENRKKRLAKDAKFKATHKAHAHDAERRKLREEWRKDARKVSGKGWVPSFAAWNAWRKTGAPAAAAAATRWEDVDAPAR